MRPPFNILLAVGLSAAAALGPQVTAAQTLAITHADLLTMGPAGEIKSGVVVIKGARSPPWAPTFPSRLAPR